VKEVATEKEMDIEFLDGIAKEVIKEFPLKIEEYQNGKTGIINMFMGQIKSRAGDKFEPRVANELLMRKLQQNVNR
jgi:aspartyl-tRNA(Asn)/glutamyl-tRNA(Gln) amidotransferase subunit B